MRHLGPEAAIRLLAIAPMRGKTMLSVLVKRNGEIEVGVGGRPAELTADEAADCQNGIDEILRILGRSPGKAAPAARMSLAHLGLDDIEVEFDSEWDRQETAFNVKIDPDAGSLLSSAVGKQSEILSSR